MPAGLGRENEPASQLVIIMIAADIITYCHPPSQLAIIKIAANIITYCHPPSQPAIIKIAANIITYCGQFAGGDDDLVLQKSLHLNSLKLQEAEEVHIDFIHLLW